MYELLMRPFVRLQSAVVELRVREVADFGERPCGPGSRADRTLPGEWFQGSGTKPSFRLVVDPTRPTDVLKVSAK
jgi:hypothetical protein